VSEDDAIPGQALAEHRAYLLRFARRRLRDAALVEDVVQDTLLAALQGLDRFGGEASVRTWLTGILLHKIADAVRREHRESSALPLPAAVETDGHVSEDALHHQDEPVDWRDPERLLEGRQLAQAVERGLAALPAPAARAFVLREIEGLSTQETARELGVSAAQGSLLLHRARNRLREQLARAAASMSFAIPAGAMR
jgi:RNA polymerase sigma-70 factor (ECF subfamily)